MMVRKLPNTKENSKNNKIIKWLNGKGYKSSTNLEFSTTPNDYFEVYFDVIRSCPELTTLLEVARQNNLSDDGIKILYQSDQNIQECLSTASLTWFENIGCFGEKYKITLKNSITNNLTPILSNKDIELVRPIGSNGGDIVNNINPENAIPQNTGENNLPVDDTENGNQNYENIQNLILERSGNRRRNIRVRVNYNTEGLPYFNQPGGLRAERSRMPMYLPLIMNHLYGQGDTQEIDNLETFVSGEDNHRTDNIVVSVLFSPYTKLMTIVLILNALFLCKLVFEPIIKHFLFQ